MKKRTKIYLIVLLITLIICNYWLYIARIKYEIWDLYSLIEFLCIANLVFITIPTIVYSNICEEIDRKEKIKLAELLLNDMIKRHEEEIKDLKEELYHYKKLSFKDSNKDLKKK